MSLGALAAGQLTALLIRTSQCFCALTVEPDGCRSLLLLLTFHSRVGRIIQWPLSMQALVEGWDCTDMCEAVPNTEVSGPRPAVIQLLQLRS